MRRLLDSHPLLWAVLALPGIWLVFAWATNTLTYGQAVSESGIWSTQLLILTLAVTPLRRIFKRGSWLIWLSQRRRDLGVATFVYAAGHLIIYLIRKANPGLILAEATDLWLLAGWLGLIILLALAVTSNDEAVRALRRNWKRLHRFVYLAAVLVFVHWTLSAFDPLEAYFHLGVLVALEVIRLPQLAAWLRERLLR